jgi:hypothetical protein
MNGNVPAAGARVSFTLTKASGAKVTGSVTADSNGSAKWSYRIGTKDPKGLWSVVNSATYNSQTLTSNTATFTVQ